MANKKNAYEQAQEDYLNDLELKQFVINSANAYNTPENKNVLKSNGQYTNPLYELNKGNAKSVGSVLDNLNMQNADIYKDELLGGGVTALGELQKNIINGTTKAPTTEQTTTPLSTPNAYSYYDTERAYQMNNLQKQRQTAIDNAVLAYQRALNPYGVEAQGLASAGMTANGGYGQRMKTNRFNAYAQGVNNAENTYQQGVSDLDRSLAYQKYTDQKEEKATAYAQAANEMTAQQNRISYAATVGKAVATWKGKNIRNQSVVEARIKSLIPTISDSELAAAISYITKD